jgi:ribonuclease HI
MEWVGKPYKSSMKVFVSLLIIEWNYYCNSGSRKLKNPNTRVLVISILVCSWFSRKWLLGKKDLLTGKCRFVETFLIVHRKHKVDFKWIKGHNNHTKTKGGWLAVMHPTQKTTFCGRLLWKKKTRQINDITTLYL